jgi:ubiquinone/menaquinone biosynthesis C-methylase UbiE
MIELETVVTCPVCGSEDQRELLETPAHMMSRADRERAEVKTFHFQQCNCCGAVFLSPRVSPQDLSFYYPYYYLPYRGARAWGKYAPLVQSGFRQMDRQRVKNLKKVVPLSSASKVLDVGCGHPTFLKELYRQTGCEAHGIDFSDEGWKDSPEAWKGLHLNQGELEVLNPDARYDAFTMWHYLEHDYHPHQTLQQLRKHALPHSRLLIEVPNVNSWARKTQQEMWEGWHAPRHTVLYEPKTMEVLLNRSGWEMEASYTYGTIDPYVAWWMGEQEKKQIDWSESMEKEFLPFMLGKITTAPRFLRQKKLSLGIMTAVARPAETTR